MRSQYCQLLRSTHFTHKLQCVKAQDCFPVLAFALIRNATLWRQLLKQLLVLNCASCEGFSMSGNTVFTSQEHAARTEVAYNLLDGMNRLAIGTIILSMVL